MNMFWITFFQMLAFGKSYTLLDQDIFEDPLTFQQKNKKTKKKQYESDRHWIKQVAAFLKGRVRFNTNEQKSWFDCR